MTITDDKRDVIPAAALDYEGSTITFAVTIGWPTEGLSMDKCEAGTLVGSVKRALLAGLTEWEGWTLNSVLTYDEREDVVVGHFTDSPWSDRPLNRPVDLATGAVVYTDRDRELQQAWRDVVACVHTATYAAHGGEFGSLTMLAEAAEGIRDALAIIHPSDADFDDDVAFERWLSLSTAIERAHRSYAWTARTLNAACTSALRITKGWDRQRQEFAS